MVHSPVFAAIHVTSDDVTSHEVSGDKARAITLVKHRVATWLRKEIDVSVQVSSNFQLKEHRFIHQLRRFVAEKENNIDWKLLKKKNIKDGKLLQSALWLRALNLLQEDKPINPVLTQLLMLHPEQSLGIEIENWDAPESVVLQKKISELKSTLKPVCQYEIGDLRDLSVNGFAVTKNFQLMASSRPYYLQSSNLAKSIRCERYQRVALKLNSSWTSPAQSASFLVVRPDGEKISIDLFTPGIGVQAVPLERPLYIAEVLQNPDRVEVLISDGFSQIVRRHLNPIASPPTEGTSEIEMTQPWYKNWVVWAVVGAVAAGVVLSQVSGSKTGSQTVGVGIRFD